MPRPKSIQGLLFSSLFLIKFDQSQREWAIASTNNGARQKFKQEHSIINQHWHSKAMFPFSSIQAIQHFHFAFLGVDKPYY